MNSPASSYYPPRAGWRSTVRRHWSLASRLSDWIQSRFPGATLGQLAAQTFVPGLGFYAHGRPRLGRWVLALWGVCALVFLPSLGYPPASPALIAMISLHALSASHAWQKFMQPTVMFRQAALGGVVWLMLNFGLYGLGREWLEAHWFRALRINDDAVVISSRVAPGEFQRGEMIVYRVNRQYYDHYRLATEWMFGRIVGLPGDRVEFGKKTFTVNGRTRWRDPDMPSSGVRVVRPDELFVQPRLFLDGQALPRETISQMLADLAQVPENNVIGRPFQSWFGRPQAIP